MRVVQRGRAEAEPHQAALLGDDGLRLRRLRLHKQHLRKVRARGRQHKVGCVREPGAGVSVSAR